MRITSVSTTPNFEARIKLKAPNMQKVKEVTVASAKSPKTHKALASTGFLAAGVGSTASAYFVPSVQQVKNADEVLPMLGTTVSELPLSAGVVAGSNELSDSKSVVSVENFLFNKEARANYLAPSKKKLESFKDPEIQRNSVLAPMVSTAAGIEYSGIAPVESVESLASGGDVADVQAVSQIAGMISLAPPASSAFASAFKELESAESSKSFLDKTFKKSDNDKKIPS